MVNKEYSLLSVFYLNLMFIHWAPLAALPSEWVMATITHYKNDEQ